MKNKTIKWVVAVVLAIAIVATAYLPFGAVQAQTYIGGGGLLVTSGTGATVAGQWTNKIAGATSFTNYTMFPMQGKDVAISFDYVYASAGISNSLIYCGYSMRPDSNYVTLLNPLQVTGNATAGAVAYGQTNYTLNAAKYFWVAIITNASSTGTQYLTNYNVYINSR